MKVYGITQDFTVKPVEMSSDEMMECLMVDFDYDEAVLTAGRLEVESDAERKEQQK